MRLRFLLPLLLLLPTVTIHAQQRPTPTTDTTFFKPSLVPRHLKPIERGPGSLGILGNTYYYGGRRLRSPSSLEIPFYELNDPNVIQHFRQARLFSTLGGILSVVPLLYLFTQRRFSSNEYWTVYGVSVAGSLAFTLIGNGQIGKAVSAYNRRLAGVPSVGLSVVPTLPTQSVAVGPSVSWRF